MGGGSPGDPRRPQSGGYNDGADPMARPPYPPQPDFPSEGSYPSDPRQDYMGQSPPDRRSQQEEAMWQQQSPQSPQYRDTYGTRPRVSGNSYASGANQNCGNVLTGVPSTRVNR